MSDITIAVLHDREKYPDDMEIVLADGVKVKVGDFRDAVIPKGDYSRETEKWSRKEKELQGAVQGLQEQLSRALQERQPAAPATVPGAGIPAGGITEEDVLADPVLGPMARRLKDAADRLTAHEARLDQHEKTWMTANYNAQLSRLGHRYNERYNEGGKGKAWDQKQFLDFALERGVSNLNVAYDAYTREDEIARTVKEAEARGEERGFKKGKTPAVPFGRRSTPKRAEGLPGSLQDLTDEQVMDDPDIQAALSGGDDQR